jgi:ElaB/YqjD/DUF883 family membrane-anchored ribosome-binding protein
MSDRSDDKKISEALEVLEEMAKRKKTELQEMVSSGYTNLGELFATLATDIEIHAKEATMEYKDAVIGLVSKVDKMVRKNPWPYIGGVALGVLILGAFQGRRKK